MLMLFSVTDESLVISLCPFFSVIADGDLTVLGLGARDGSWPLVSSIGCISVIICYGFQPM